MAGYIGTFCRSGTTGLVRLIRSDLLLGVCVYEAERQILAEYKLREDVSFSNKVLAQRIQSSDTDLTQVDCI